MPEFSFSNNAFPEQVTSLAGERFPINADFRNILEILKTLNDAELSEPDKLLVMVQRFYTATLPADLDTAVQLFYDFTFRPANAAERDTQAPQIDYDFDAEEIYVSFLSAYHIDLTDIPFLHWRKFQMLLVNLPGDCPFSHKLWLRGLDLRKYKGEDYVRMARAKRAAQIPMRLSAEDQQAFDDAIAKLL